MSADISPKQVDTTAKAQWPRPQVTLMVLIGIAVLISVQLSRISDELKKPKPIVRAHWEYEVIASYGLHPPVGSGAGILAEIEKMSQRGWEYVTVFGDPMDTNHTSMVKLVFRRQK
jgi:hypothetical protein